MEVILPNFKKVNKKMISAITNADCRFKKMSDEIVRIKKYYLYKEDKNVSNT